MDTLFKAAEPIIDEVLQRYNVDAHTADEKARIYQQLYPKLKSPKRLAYAVAKVIADLYLENKEMPL